MTPESWYLASRNQILTYANVVAGQDFDLQLLGYASNPVKRYRH
jgi:hypothetical protein